jgi:hypothetical protein
VRARRLSTLGGLGAARESFIDNIPFAVVAANATRRRSSTALSISRALASGGAILLGQAIPLPSGHPVSARGGGGGGVAPTSARAGGTTTPRSQAYHHHHHQAHLPGAAVSPPRAGARPALRSQSQSQQPQPHPHPQPQPQPQPGRRHRLSLHSQHSQVSVEYGGSQSGAGARRESELSAAPLICSVCLDEVVRTEGSARPVGCVHTFHWVCLSEVINKHAQVCPNCREPIEAVCLDGKLDPVIIEPPPPQQQQQSHLQMQQHHHHLHAQWGEQYDDGGGPMVDMDHLNAVLEVLHRTASRKAQRALEVLCLPLTSLLFTAFMFTVLAAAEKVAPAVVAVMPLAMWSFATCATEAFLVAEAGLSRARYVFRLLSELVKVTAGAVFASRIDGTLAGSPRYAVAMIGFWVYAPLPIISAIAAVNDPLIPVRRRIALASPVIVNVWLPLVLAGALLAARLDGDLSITAYYVAAPVLYAALCATVLVPSATWVFLAPLHEYNPPEISRRRRATAAVLIASVFALALAAASVVMAAMHIEGDLDVAWALVLAPLAVLGIAVLITSIVVVPHAWIALNEAKFQYDLTPQQLLNYLRGARIEREF